MQKEISPALHLAWEVFVQDVAPSYTPEGVGEFQKFIQYENMMQKYQNKELFFFGAFERNVLVGMIAANKEGHICLFFVKKENQGHGIGRALFRAICNYCVQVYGVNLITVNAAPGSVEKYRRFGMIQVREEEEKHGIRSIPMELQVINSRQFTQPKQTSKGVIIAAVVLGAVLLIGAIAGMIALSVNIYKGIVEESVTIEIPADEEEFPDSVEPKEDFAEEEETQEEDATGIEAISPYIDENLSYEIEEEIYTNPEQAGQTVYLDLKVKYPKLSGLDSKVADEINEIIKECAMKTVDEIYLNPSDEMKEKVLEEDYPVLVSYVEYKVCYANDEFISIMFQDDNFKGSTEEYNSDLRTINIRLEDGKVYEVKDIIEIDNAFIDEWLQVMQEETGDSSFLSELSRKEMKKALSGDSMDDVYVVNFFVSDGEIEIGFDLNYPDDSSAYSQYAWVTAPFEFTNINKYALDSSFWNDL